MNVRRIYRAVLTIVALVALLVTIPFSAGISQAADATCKTDKTLWVGSFGYGANCLDDAGWKSFVKGKSQLQSDQVNSLALCADNSVWISNTLGLLMITADKEQTVKMNDAISGVESIACDGKGGVWIAHFKGISHYSGDKWETTDAKNLGTGDSVDLVKKVVVAPNGDVYAITSNSVAHFDGKQWTYFEKGKGFDKDYFFDSITVDSKGIVYAIAGSSLLIYDGKVWKAQDNDKIYTAKAIAVDSKGVVWVGTFSQGVFAFDGKGWTSYNVKQNKLSSDGIVSIAIDQQDRVWLGTDYGLDVLVGKDVQVYQMATSGLVDNSIKALAVSGSGPTLPTRTAARTGSLSGNIVEGSSPVANTTVQLCTSSVPSSFSGDTPCDGQTDSLTIKTDKDGKFSFDKLPIGHYELVVQNASGKWLILSNSFGLNAKFDVKDGQNNDIGKIDLSKKSS